MKNLAIIGGMPSSGSTLLVELLSDRPDVLCLPETGLFSHGRNLVDLADDTDRHDLTWSLPWLSTGTKIAQALGWNASEFDRMGERYTTTLELLDERIERNPGTLVVEKTPENVFALSRYLDGDPNRRAVVTSRDAPSVIQSLMRRDFGLAEAAIIWFAYAYHIAGLLEAYPDRLFHCRYRTLTAWPRQTVDLLMRFLNRPCKPAPSKSSGADTNRDRIRSMLSLSQWELTDTAWMRSPRQPPTAEAPVDMIGLRLGLILDRGVFVTRGHGPVRAADLEVVLNAHRVAVPVHAGPTHRLSPRVGTPIGRCLLEHFEARCVEGAA